MRARGSRRCFNRARLRYRRLVFKNHLSKPEGKTERAENAAGGDRGDNAGLTPRLRALLTRGTHRTPRSAPDFMLIDELP